MSDDILLGVAIGWVIAPVLNAILDFAAKLILNYTREL